MPLQFILVFEAPQLAKGDKILKKCPFRIISTTLSSLMPKTFKKMRKMMEYARLRIHPLRFQPRIFLLNSVYLSN